MEPRETSNERRLKDKGAIEKNVTSGPGRTMTALRKEEAMKTQTRDLLVVDDEQVVCESCARILGERGFRVQTETDPSKALRMATENDYAVILLDIKMPTIDGFEFIRELKKKHRNVRVVMITGYPSTENFETAEELGAVDFIPKPFSPDELLDAVTKFVPEEHTVVDTAVSEPEESLVAAVGKEAESVERRLETQDAGRIRFLDEAWVKPDDYGVARVGALLSGDEAREIIGMRLPTVGDLVHKGLPLASFSVNGRPEHVVPSPVTGEIVEVNTALINAKPGTWHNPCRDGWIARIRPENLENDIAGCDSRHVVLAIDDERAGKRRAKELSELGCVVDVAVSPATTLEAIRRSEANLVLIDAASFESDGPRLVDGINEDFAGTKVVVVADPDSRWESEYRTRRIFYYAVRPLTNAELIDILSSTFGAAIEPAPETAPSRKLPNQISKVSITNHHSQEVNLLVTGEALASNKGVGLQLRSLIFSKRYPITFTLGARRFGTIDLIREANLCDRMLVLDVKDTGKVPGAVTVIPGCEALKGVSGNDNTIKTLLIQPSAQTKGEINFDARTCRAIAGFILNEMTSK